MDFLSGLSARNLFQNLFPVQPQQQEEEEQYDPAARLAQLYQPQHQGIDQLRSAMESAPDRASYEPNKFHKIMAAIAGLGEGSGPAAMIGGTPVGFRGDVSGGIRLQNDINNAPYERAVSDWKNKLAPIEKIAEIERLNNSNSRTVANNVISGELRDRTIDRQVKRDQQLATEGDTRLKQSQDRINITAQRAKIYQFKAENPDHKIETDKEGNFIGINPQDNTFEFILDEGGNKIKSDKLSDAEKLKLSHGYRSSEINQRGAVQKSVKAAPKPAGVPVKPESPSQEKIRRYNRAVEAKNTHPEWAPYISIQQGSNFGVAAPESGGSAEVLNEINKYIYGSTANQVSTTPKAPAGWKYVKKAGGGWTAVEDK